MSRASDIRTYIVNKQPLMTIDQLYVLVAQLHASVESLIELRQNNEKPPMTVTIKNVTFELRGNKLHTKEGIVFSPSSLETFVDTLLVMKGAMGIGYRTFATIDPNVYGDLLLACANVESDVAKINAEIFSGLLKRYHNKGRAGANNDYQFKFRLETCKDRFITFDLKNMVFDDKDHVDFDIEINDQILEDAIGGHHRYPMPTATVASQRLSEKLQCAFTEVKTPDTFMTLCKGLDKHGMPPHEISSLTDVLMQWLKGNKLTCTVVCTDEKRAPYHVSFGRVEPRWDEISITIMDGNKTIILGTSFHAPELVSQYEACKRTRIVVPTEINDQVAAVALVMTREEKAVYYSLIEKELDPEVVDFSAKATPAEKRLISVDPRCYNGDSDILFRPWAFSGQGSMTTLSLVSWKDAMENSKIIRALMESVNDDSRKVNWGDIVDVPEKFEPGSHKKPGILTRIVRWFKG